MRRSGANRFSSPPKGRSRLHRTDGLRPVPKLIDGAGMALRNQARWPRRSRENRWRREPVFSAARILRSPLLHWSSRPLPSFQEARSLMVKSSLSMNQADRISICSKTFVAKHLTSTILLLTFSSARTAISLGCPWVNAANSWSLSWSSLLSDNAHPVKH